MNNNLTTRLLWLFSAVFLFIGIGLTVQNLRKCDDLIERFKKKSGELKILRNMQADIFRYEAARHKMEQLAEKHPVALNAIIQEALGGIKVEDIRDSRKELVGGWAVRQKEISINDVSIEKVMEFIRKAESQKMPWCLSRCVIRTAPGAAGTGQIVLQMEAVEKSE